jgi:hypothetical protein
MRKIVGNGQNSYFWTDPWIGNRILKDDFERLYSVSNFKEAKISEVGTFVNGRWEWIC